jgi:hypothetical protein
MEYIKLSDILELKSPYKELIETEAGRIKDSTGGVVSPEEFVKLVEEQNQRIQIALGCSEEFSNVLGEIARCRAADLTREDETKLPHTQL